MTNRKGPTEYHASDWLGTESWWGYVWGVTNRNGPTEYHASDWLGTESWWGVTNPNGPWNLYNFEIALTYEALYFYWPSLLNRNLMMMMLLRDQVFLSQTVLGRIGKGLE